MSKPRSLSLAAYRILSWNGPNAAGHYDLPRPEGEVLWVHVAEQDRLRAVCDFCLRLQQTRPGISVILTAPPDAELSRWTGSTYPLVTLPVDSARTTRGFLDHWRPDMALWVGGGLMPNLITRADEQDIPMILIEAPADITVPLGVRWLPDIARCTFDCFQTILAPTAEAARQIRRLGVTSTKVAEAPPLQISPIPRSWPEDELIEITHAFAGRPVWLAAGVIDKEFISVLSAHRQALRVLPRLALILHVADTSEAAPLHRRLEAMDLRCANWDDGAPIEDTTQVILSSEPEDLGLWHRVSSVSFMASSLERGAGGRDPQEAIALGSAIIHGPFVHRYQDMYDRLKQDEAAQEVRTATELGDAVEALLAPDRAADMALAGWQMITEGAPQADLLIDMIQEALDQRSAQDASP